MDDAARARAATLEAIEDVTPPALRDVLEARIGDANVTPGVLTLLSARATSRSDGSANVERRAAGVQLIYDGLALTRRLARDPPWGNGEGTAGAATDGVEAAADMAILAADVLVGRGFFLLARTDAAPVAVETVRSFGRNETSRERGDVAEHALEADVFELAIVAGTTAAGVDPPPASRRFAVGLAESFDPDRQALGCDSTVEALDRLLTDRDSPPSPERVWAGSSDP